MNISAPSPFSLAAVLVSRDHLDSGDEVIWLAPILRPDGTLSLASDDPVAEKQLCYPGSILINLTFVWQWLLEEAQALHLPRNGLERRIEGYC